MNSSKPIARIAQMTWYQSQNYGSVLQAYALQRTLRNMGADARLVNYDPAPWQQRNQSSLRKSKPFRAARVCQQRLMGAAPYVSDEKDAAFHAFASKYIRETEPVSLFEDFSILNSHFDAFVCGSDQVWSPRCYDPRYFLDFVADDRLRIAYAPSFGCDKLPAEASAAMAPLVRKFDALSAREAEGARMVEELCDGECQVVCDPVVLLEADDWRSISRRDGHLVSDEYCLCYFLGRSEENWERARGIAKTLGLKLVMVPVFNGDVRRDGLALSGVGPLEFLSLIDRASYVCTDSFHGLVFSSIFERDFSVFERFKAGSSASQNVRIENFLRMAGLEHRLLRRGVSDADDIACSIDYAASSKRVAALLEQSLRYLRGALASLLGEERE